MLNGEKGQDKQLFADVITSYYYIKSDIVEEIMGKNTIYKVANIKYMNDEDLKDFFGFQKFQIDNWITKEKVLLKEVLYNTPVSYVKNRQLVLYMYKESLENYKELFPIKKTLKVALKYFYSTSYNSKYIKCFKLFWSI